MRGGILKPDIVSDFKFRSKCMFGAELRKESIEREFKGSQTSFPGHKCIKNVWRPGSARTRWGSLGAPPDPLAAVGRIILQFLTAVWCPLRGRVEG